MAANITDEGKRSFAIQPLDADKQPTNPDAGDTCVVTSSDPTIVSVSQDSPSSDPTKWATGFVVAVAIGTATLTATPLHADGTPIGSPITQDVTVIAGEEVTGGFVLGAEVPK